MEVLFEKFQQRLKTVGLDFQRSLMDDISWEARLIGIKGARGVGKTTLLLQYIKNNLPLDESTLYVSLDNIWFGDNSLYDLTDQFVKRGGRYLFLDEVHKYPRWSQEIKNIYDDFPELKLVFTGSSLLEILNARADLSRRAIVYQLQGLSYREFLQYRYGITFSRMGMEDILQDHLELSRAMLIKFNPLQYFDEYLKNGYFPFFSEGADLYFQRIEEVINMILEIELPLLRKVDMAYVTKLKQLLQVLAESVPFVPNVSKLSARIGLNRNTFTAYLHFLQEAGLTVNLYKDASGISILQKPNKIFLENTNFHFALNSGNAEKGALRETFFANQLKYAHQLEYAEQGDFEVDNKYLFEIGGKGKSYRQIGGKEGAFIAADEIEYGYGNKIPLWLFGFLY